MKQLSLPFLTFCLACCNSGTQMNAQHLNKETSMNQMQSTHRVTENFYDLSVLSINGKDTMRMSDFRGKKILIVNVASKCGYTPQYEALQKLYESRKEKLVIIGFPCNQFMNQEPGSEEEIGSFCKLNYGVSFPLTSKIEVKGSNQHPIYQWLTQKSLNGQADYKVSWNFNKFLISENGELLAYFGSSVDPLDESLISLL